MQDKNLEYRIQNIESRIKTKDKRLKSFNPKFYQLSTCKTKAFTLVELIVTIVILAILTTIAFISFQGYSKSSRDSVRIADINNLEKSLGIYVVKTGFYPIPDNSTEITYLGGTAWIEGTIGDTVMRNIDNISKKPTDPLTSNEYTYSITTSKKEYEIGSISEGQEIGYNNFPTNKTYAADLNNAVAYMKGNYNEKIIKISTGGVNYVLAIPTIIVTDISNPRIESLLSEKKLVYRNYENLPHSYNSTGTGGFNYETNKLVVYSGSTINLEDNTNKLDFVKNLQDAYSGTILGGAENYVDITNIDTITEPDKAVDLVNNYITNNVGGISGKITTVTYNSCTLDGQSINHNQTVTAYSENSILFGASYECVDRSQERTCNNGVLSGDDSYQYKSCVKGTPNNCEASGSYVYNNHTYSIPSVNHGGTATNIESLDVNENHGTYTYTLTSIGCNDGTFVNETESSTPIVVSCDSGYTISGNSCVTSTYTVSGDFGTNASGAIISVCGSDMTADGNGLFSTTRNYGDVCNNITAIRTGYTCSTTTNGPASLTSNITNIAGSCSANSYTVTFDGNGGTGHSPTIKLVAYNTAIGTLPTEPTMTGYTFNGWFTASTGGTQVTTSTVVLGDSTVYAQWSINNYTVTFDGNGGTGHAPTTMSVAYGSQIGTLPTNPTRSGYTFNGWFTASTGGTQVTTSTVVLGASTVYAQWTSSVGSMTLKYNGLVSGDIVKLQFKGTVNITNIDWGDDGVNSCPTSATGAISCTYTNASKGNYTINVSGTTTGYGSSTTTSSSIAKLSEITQWQGMGLTDLSYAFYGATNLVYLDPALDTSNVTNMYSMFYGATSFNQSLASFNTSNVTNMGYMFRSATSFNGIISNFDTSKVTNMSAMFRGASSFNQSISNFDTSNVIEMNVMFNGATVFDQSVSSFNTLKVTSMYGMFQNAISFNHSVSSFDTSNVTNMSRMFGGASSFNQSISNFNTSNVTNMYCMFYGATAFNQSVSNFNTSNVTNMGHMFSSALVFNQSVSSFDTSNVTDMSYMFSNAYIFNQSVSNFNTSNVTNMAGMFNNAKVFNQSLSNFNTAKVTSMSTMFSNAQAFNQSLASFNTSNVTNMSMMFQNAAAFNQSVSSFDTSKITGMGNMFYGATAFNQSVSNFNTSNVTSMYQMFSLATLFNQSLASFDTSKVTDMTYMFLDSTNFNKNISCWNVSLISSEPSGFSIRSALILSNKPLWGTNGSTGTCE